jgi:hypothetical protein
MEAQNNIKKDLKGHKGMAIIEVRKEKKMGTTERKLQYQLSNGSWTDCAAEGFTDRTEQYLALCQAANGRDETGKIVPVRPGVDRGLTREEVLTALERGAELNIAQAGATEYYWYDNCRFAPEPRPAPKPNLVRCDCGHEVLADSVMNSSRGTSCLDCYDRMSL